MPLADCRTGCNGPLEEISMKKTTVYPAGSLLSAWAAYGQEVAVDWASKKITSQPSSVEKDMMVNIRVDNVNDLMFTYSISYVLKPLTISDFDSIAKAFSIAGKAAAGEAVSACDFSDVLLSQKALTDAEAAFLKAPATNKGC